MTEPAAQVSPPEKLTRLAIDNAEELLAAALLFIIGASVAAQILSRTLFGAPLTWPEELSQFLFIWASLFGAIGAMKRHQLIRLGLIVEKMPPYLLMVANAVVLVGTIAVLGLLCWYGWLLASRTSFAATTLPVTWAWAYAAAPVFAILATVRLIQRSVLSYRFAFVETAFAARRTVCPGVERQG